jgi:two-component system response regulator DevR
MTAETKPVRVFIVDDSELVRLGLRSLIEDTPGLKLVGEAATVRAAQENAPRAKPDVVLLDIRLPDGTGFDACRQLRASLPSLRILMLTSVLDEQTISAAVNAGAHGYLLKEVDSAGLVEAILGVAAGKTVFDSAAMAKMADLVRHGEKSRDDAGRLALLSPQEQRVMALLAEGLTNKEIGARLNLTEKTVKNYLATVFDKLGITRRAQAAALFVQARQP